MQQMQISINSIATRWIFHNKFSLQQQLHSQNCLSTQNFNVNKCTLQINVNAMLISICSNGNAKAEPIKISGKHIKEINFAQFVSFTLLRQRIDTFSDETNKCVKRH